ncbi:MAG: class I SAM-dependent methyltransferase [Planctomycetota bacterium]|nr:class I SAM-dependent methyltransferase [Planctomycetota bacterium]
MNPAEFDRMFEIEETHWWYRGRRSLVRHALDTHVLPNRGGGEEALEILDVACATGMSFRFLNDYGNIRGVDISEETIEYCGRRGIDRIVRADAVHLPFGEESFDVVLALDAFEHFDDDKLAMSESYRVLRPGGVLVVTVPAFMILWSPHDDAYHHKRRYRRPQLRKRLLAAGFDVERMSYSTMSLFPPVLALRTLRRLVVKEETEVASDFALSFPRPIEALADFVTRLELAVERKVDLPFGVSLFGVVRKPAS